MAKKRKTEKPTPDNASKTMGTISETDETMQPGDDRYGKMPTFEKMQGDLTGLYD